ncbi:MAG: DUF898 domain-containing protein [Desulfobacter sp.]|nr:MAG: DUF898 domain-containing protein [Desulfobacter sp.]
MHEIQFSGTAGEYFKIWIVNLFLTIITCGIYAAWAKVRTRQYFYANTTIAGHPFDYLANPVNILKGHLIVGALFICYLVTEQFSPEWAFVLIGLFYMVFPFLAYKSIQFYTHNSAHRNIRFTFKGTLKQSYQLFLLKPLVIPLTLGLYFPRWIYQRKKWVFGHSGFGSTMNEFSASSKVFYKAYIFASIQFILIFAIPLCIMIAFVFMTEGMSSSQSIKNPQMLSMASLSILASYTGVILAGAVSQQYIFSTITNHCWNSSRLGHVFINSRLKTGRLVFIQVTNILAILFSLGLMMPWAKIRRTRYILESLSIETGQSLDEFTAGNQEEVTAVGDAAVDFFDFEIGL